MDAYLDSNFMPISSIVFPEFDQHYGMAFQEKFKLSPEEEAEREELKALIRRMDAESPLIKFTDSAAESQGKIPEKVGDPESFILPCVTKGVDIEHAVCDLGASVNMMPLSLATKLKISTIKPTSVEVSLADCSVRKPYGMVTNILVWVENKFLVPTDFIIMEIEDEKEGSLILGRPFLATAGALIDVPNGEITLRVKGESMTFKRSFSEDPPDEHERKRSREEDPPDDDGSEEMDEKSEETISLDAPQGDEKENGVHCMPRMIRVTRPRKKEKKEKGSQMDHQIF